MSTKLTASQIEQYWNIRLDGYKLHHSKGSKYRAMCPLHGGGNASQLSVDFGEGHFVCFSCGEKGNSTYAFEQRMLTAELNRSPLHDEVQSSLEKILDAPLTRRVHEQPLNDNQKGWNRKQARERYVYTDEEGAEVFTVYRFVDRWGKKMTPPDRPCSCKNNPDAECALGCTDGRIWGLTDVRRVLYHLADVMQSIVCFVVEGEKNVNDLSRALAAYIKGKGGFEFGNLIVDRIAVTTNPGGASSWKTEHGFGRYFFGKTVIKLGDNDIAGRLHDRDACNDIARYARNLFTLDLPVGEGEDISDYLESHSVTDFLKLLANRKTWQVTTAKQPHFKGEEAQRIVLVKPSKLVAQGATAGGDWLVDGLIARGKRGLVVAAPKVGKSLLFLDLVTCLATNQSFLGSRPYGKTVKCAVISREDGPDLVHSRLQALGRGRGLSWEEIDRNVSVNTREQTARFNIDSQKDLVEMAEWLKADGTEFAVFDVLNKLHQGEENSSTEMTKVMQQFDELALLAGCQVCVIHHTNKTGGAKGSTSIEGWADYIVRLEECPDGDGTLKTLFLRTKSSSAVPPRSIRYWQSDDKTESKIQLGTMRQEAVPSSRPSLVQYGQSRYAGGGY